MHCAAGVISIQHIMTSSNGNIFRVTGHFVREIHRSPGNSPHKGQWRGVLMFSLICAPTDDLGNNQDAGDLRRHRAHYDVNVMSLRQKRNKTQQHSDHIYGIYVILWVVLQVSHQSSTLHDKWSGGSFIITMTSQRARWRLRSPASRLFTQSFIQVQIKENIKAPRHWPLCGEFNGDRWIPRTKGH